MNRREFFRRSIQGLALAGLGRLTVGCSWRSLPVTALAVPDLDKDYHREFARILADDKLELPFLHQPVAVFNHRLDLVGGINVDERKRDVAEKGLPGKP